MAQDQCIPTDRSRCPKYLGVSKISIPRTTDVIIITMNSSVVLMIVMLLASHVSCSPIVPFSWDTPRHFCGSQLANMLQIICRQGYNFHKLSEDVTSEPDFRRKRSLTIVEECCENTCTPKYLKSYCWESDNQRSDKRITDTSVERPLVDKNPKPQKALSLNTLSQRPDTVVDNRVLVESTTVIPRSNSIIPNSKEHSRKNDIKYIPKKEAMRPSGRVKTVTPYFDKMPSVIITKITQH